MSAVPMLGQQRPSGSSCCTHAPNRPGHVNKDLANGADTKPSTADLRIVTSDTSVDTSRIGVYTLQTAIEVAYPGGNNCVDTSNAYAIISLPQYSVVREAKATSASGRELPIEQCKAQIRVKLSYLCPNSGKDKITVTVARAPKGSGADCQPSFSVFAFSGMPDNNPSNNYWWWRRTCGTGPKDYTPLDPTWGPQ